MVNTLHTGKMPQRESNFELLRLISMFMILALHYCQCGFDGCIYLQQNKMNAILSVIFGSWGTAGVGCFFLISGYFMSCRKKFLSKSAVKVFLETSFYSCAIYIILSLCGKETFSGYDFALQAITPVLACYWYITVYLMLYFAIPFINEALSNMSPKTIRKSLIIFTFLIPIYVFFCSNAPVGYFIYAIYMYATGYYIRHYSDVKNEKRIIRLTSVVTLISVSAMVAISCLDAYLPSELILSRFRGIISPTQASLALLLFLLFKNLQFKNSRIINWLAKSTLAVYIVHMNVYIRSIIWNDILQSEKYSNTSVFIFHLIFSCISVYISISFIDVFWRRIWGLISNIKILDRLCLRVDKWYTE